MHCTTHENKKKLNFGLQNMAMIPDQGCKFLFPLLFGSMSFGTVNNKSGIEVA